MSATPRAAAALVREVSPRLARAELTYHDRRPIDVDLARRQHGAYVDLLRRHGLSVVELPPAPEHPDGVFVEDVAVVVDDLAVLTRPGAASRRGEVDTLRPTLERLGLTVAAVTPPATLDGGDVLQVGRTVYVGMTGRTNDAAACQLTALLAPLGREVVPVDVRGVLHLKSAATALPDGALLALPGRVDPAAFAGRELVPAPEPSGADVLVINDAVVVAASAPATLELVRDRGFEAEAVDIGELEKAEAGPTCPSVLLPTVVHPAMASRAS